jgi:hypothetical protein
MKAAVNQKLDSTITLTTWHPLSAKVGTLPISCGRSVGIVRSMTQATEFTFFFNAGAWTMNAAANQKLYSNTKFSTFIS